MGGGIARRGYGRFRDGSLPGPRSSRSCAARRRSGTCVFCRVAYGGATRTATDGVAGRPGRPECALTRRWTPRPRCPDRHQRGPPPRGRCRGRSRCGPAVDKARWRRWRGSAADRRARRWRASRRSAAIRSGAATTPSSASPPDCASRRSARTRSTDARSTPLSPSSARMARSPRGRARSRDSTQARAKASSSSIPRSTIRSIAPSMRSAR